jgi:hypothetical protein
MSVAELYPPREIKRRSTKAEVGARRAGLRRLAEQSAPATVRQIYYLATVAGLVPKTEDGYQIVKTDLTVMRRQGSLPYRWLADSTRWQRKPRTFDSIEEALEETARLYRKALWTDANCYVEIWLEKDALSGVVLPVTEKFDVPLMVARGYASLSFLHSAAEAITDRAVPAYIYHLGDFDPSGQDAARAIEQTLREMASAAEIHFERLAVTPEQIGQWRLPTRPTKKTDSRSKGFGDISVELDAIPPGQLRTLVQRAIERHLPPEHYRVLKVAEASEKQLIGGLVGMAKSKLPPKAEKPPMMPIGLALQQPAPKMPVQASASLASYFDLDWLSEEENAAWALYAEALCARGYELEHITNFIGFDLMERRGYRSPVEYLGLEQWRELKEGRGFIGAPQTPRIGSGLVTPIHDVAGAGRRLSLSRRMVVSPR